VPEFNTNSRFKMAAINRKYYEFVVCVVQIVMVMEMAGHGDLLEYVRLRGALNEDKARCMFTQLVSAVQYMHGFDVVHRCANAFHTHTYTVSQKNVLTLKRYSSKLQGVILMKFGRNIQNTLE